MQIEGLCNWLWPQRGEPGTLSARPALSLLNSLTFLGATNTSLPLGCFWDQGTYFSLLSQIFCSWGPVQGLYQSKSSPLILCSVLDALGGCLPQAQRVTSAPKPSLGVKRIQWCLSFPDIGGTSQETLFPGDEVPMSFSPVLGKPMSYPQPGW